MYANNLEQIHSFFIFILLGMLISIIFDIFRILRKTFKTLDIITYIEDTIFWIITVLIIIFFIFYFNNGELRLYLFISMLIGIIIYMLFISKYFISVNVFIINFIKKLINKILHIFLKPIKLFYYIIKKVIFRPISFICINFNKIFTNIFRKFKKIKILNKKLDKNEGI